MQQNHNYIHLFGDPEENFYILGKRDKDSFEEVQKQISMLCTRSQYTSKALKFITELSRRLKYLQSFDNLKELRAYADGLETSVDNVLYTMLLPEIVASFNKWMPNLLSLIPGCSSLFMRDKESGEVIHSRILDYSLAGPFEKHERSILYDFPHKNKVLSFSTSGMPYPAISAINDQGLSLALHYKHGQYFHPEGQSIFIIASELMHTCSNIREAIKFIKGQNSISYWGIYLADQNGEVASIDIKGHETFQEKFDLKDHDFLYFNNRPLVKKADQQEIQPFGNSNQCLMRKNYLYEQMSKIKFSTKEDKAITLMKVLGTPQIGKQQTSAKNWVMPTTTSSSIQLVSFKLNSKEAYFTLGQAPKFFLGNYIHFTSIFENLKFEHHYKKSPPKKAEGFIEGMQRLSKFQSAFDIGDIAKAYHEIQMAIVLLHSCPEKFIADFYFGVLQYIYESDKRDLTYLYRDFENLAGKLPAYLEDHRKLFLIRLGKIIGHKLKLSETDFSYPELKNIYHKENKLNAVAIKGLRYLIFPRIDILDIIYAY